MKTKQDMVENELPGYTDRKLSDFTGHIYFVSVGNI
jgi:hypothetical protein